jgi:RimJ/RimL family protein N-acetyltransferase
VLLAPLFDVRLRTPRLELRLPSDEELVELRELAHAGVHPPEEMPFAVPWTDEPYSKDFVVAYHRHELAAWRPDSWHLHLGVWAEGHLAGSQSMLAQRFAQTLTIKTASWLGQAFQRRGYGTEMRAAVLELAFRGLGARLAVSGALDENIASRRVSEKLGYRIRGHDTVAPRGTPMAHTIFEITQAQWRPPVEVNVQGLAAALPLFGIDS